MYGLRRGALALVCLMLVLALAPPVPKTLGQGLYKSSKFEYYLTLAIASNSTSTSTVSFSWTVVEKFPWGKSSFTGSSKPFYDLGYMNCIEERVSSNDPDAFRVFAWQFSLDPGEIVEVTMTFEAEAFSLKPDTITRDQVGNIGDIPRTLRQKYTNETYYWDYSSGEVANVISEINESIGGSRNVYDIVLAVKRWITENFVYDYPYEFDYPTYRVKASELLKRTGNMTVSGRYTGVCRHLAHLAVALLRGFGVPAKYVTGWLFYQEPGNSSKILFLGFHAWVRVYIPFRNGTGTWRDVEVTTAGSPYALDITRLGLNPYPYVYVPDYVEFYNEREEDLPNLLILDFSAGVLKKASQYQAPQGAGGGGFFQFPALLAWSLLPTAIVIAILAKMRKARRVE